MYLNQFSVRVIGGNEVSGGYVEMRHGTIYMLALHNGRDVRCDAKVSIDGKEIATWRIEPNQTIKLERPANDNGCFTFYELGTTEAQQAQLQNTSDLGLIAVTFTPEVKVIRPVHTHTYSVPIKDWEFTSTCFDLPVASTYSSSTTMRSAGGTGLSGSSNQVYGVASGIEYDYSQQTTIYLRLVGVKNQVRPLVQNANPIPPRVES